MSNIDIVRSSTKNGLQILFSWLIYSKVMTLQPTLIHHLFFLLVFSWKSVSWLLLWFWLLLSTTLCIFFIILTVFFFSPLKCTWIRSIVAKCKHSQFKQVISTNLHLEAVERKNGCFISCGRFLLAALVWMSMAADKINGNKNVCCSIAAMSVVSTVLWKVIENITNEVIKKVPNENVDISFRDFGTPIVIMWPISTNRDQLQNRWKCKFFRSAVFDSSLYTLKFSICFVKFNNFYHEWHISNWINSNIIIQMRPGTRALPKNPAQHSDTLL